MSGNETGYQSRPVSSSPMDERLNRSRTLSRTGASSAPPGDRFGTTGGSTSASRRGVKPTLDQVEETVLEHSEMLRRHEEVISDVGTSVSSRAMRHPTTIDILLSSAE